MGDDADRAPEVKEVRQNIKIILPCNYFFSKHHILAARGRESECLVTG